MIGVIRIKDYSGIVLPGKKSVINKSLKQGWADATRYFHDHLRDLRFSEMHAREAGYAPRKGQQAGVGTKAFFRSYTGRKWKKFGHTNPLEFSGATRRAVAGYVSISSTSKGGRAAYPGARVFNFRNPFSNPAMNLNLEFRRITYKETLILAEVVDNSMEKHVNEFHLGSTDPEVMALLGY